MQDRPGLDVAQSATLQLAGRMRSAIGRLIFRSVATAVIALLAWGLPSALPAQLPSAGMEFQINTYTTDSQGLPSVATAANGDFVVVWQSYLQDGSGNGVFGQRYAGGGSALGTEFQVNTVTLGPQFEPAVGADGAGNFVVVWSAYQDGDESGIVGRRYDSGGSPLGTEFQVNSYTTEQQSNPAIAVASDGTFVVVWSSYGQDGSHFGVFGQRFASSGSSVGTEFQVNTYTTDRQVDPAVAIAADGSFAVVWSSYASDGSGFGISAQRFASSGSPLGGEFVVNTYTPFGQEIPAIAMAPDGAFVVVWDGTLGQDGDGLGVFGQRFASSGSALGTEFQVNSHTTSDQRVAAVAVADEGDFIVTWNSPQDGDQFGIFGQHFARNGRALGSEFQVNTYTTSTQFAPTVAWAANGDFVVAWESYDQDGQYYGIFGQRYVVPPPVPGCATAPLSDCTTPGKSLLLVKDQGEDGAGPKDKLIWKWLKGPAIAQSDFGNPTATADYDFCIYAGSAQALAVAANVPSGPAWDAISTKGYQYKDATAAVDGVKQILLKGNSAGRSKLLVKGKDGGLDLDASTLPFDSAATVTVQLSNSDNANCWQSTFAPASVKRNTDHQFKAKTP